MSKKITFDVFIRGCITLGLAALAIYLINYLSDVLIPFVVALLLAYMLNPFVNFIQNKLHLHKRVLSVLVTLLIVFFVTAAFVAVITPPLIDQVIKLKDIAGDYINHLIYIGMLPENFSSYVLDYIANLQLTNADYISLAQELVPRIMSLIGQTATYLYGISYIVFTLLYMVFILIDYDRITKGWVKYIPFKHRRRVLDLFYDVKDQMHGYFRGQALIALIVGILFSVGFTIINFPVAIGLGLFIGVLNLVPYLQTVGLIPTILLALMKSADTGESFWIILLEVLAVFAVVQAIQDVYLTPRIMGKQMGLNPAIILLSLSIWGSLLGLIGLIIALPLTSVLKAYYTHYLERTQSGIAPPAPDIPNQEAPNEPQNS
ncbi:MAG: AI-2E family transporter [Bacteroidaceae bacterium]|nr:AI-2E family transporter [Bacteroidaceae bacterium]